MLFVVCVPVVCPASDPRLIFFTFNQAGRTMEDGNDECVVGLLEQLRKEREEREEERKEIEEEREKERTEREGESRKRKRERGKEGRERVVQEGEAEAGEER